MIPLRPSLKAFFFGWSAAFAAVRARERAGSKVTPFAHSQLSVMAWRPPKSSSSSAFAAMRLERHSRVAHSRISAAFQAMATAEMPDGRSRRSCLGLGLSRAATKFLKRNQHYSPLVSQRVYAGTTLPPLVSLCLSAFCVAQAQVYTFSLQCCGFATRLPHPLSENSHELLKLQVNQKNLGSFGTPADFR